MSPPSDAIEYPTFSDDLTSLQDFEDVLNSPVPKVLNWHPQHVKDAMTLSGHTIMEGMSQDVIDNTNEVNILDECQDVPIRKRDINDCNKYHHWTSYIKDLCKYDNACNDRNFSYYVDIVLQKILTSAIQFENGEFDVNKEIPQENLTSDNEDFMSKRILSQDVIHYHTDYQVSYISSFPGVDVRKKDRRIIALFER